MYAKVSRDSMPSEVTVCRCRPCRPGRTLSGVFGATTIETNNTKLNNDISSNQASDTSHISINPARLSSDISSKQAELSN